MHRRRHAAESPQAVLEDIACPARTRQCQHPTRKVKFGCDCTPELSRLERTPTVTSARRRLLILRRFKRPPEVLRATARGRRPRRGRSRDCLFHAAPMDTDVLCDTTISRQSYEQGCPGKTNKGPISPLGPASDPSVKPPIDTSGNRVITELSTDKPVATSLESVPTYAYMYVRGPGRTHAYICATRAHQTHMYMRETDEKK